MSLIIEDKTYSSNFNGTINSGYLQPINLFGDDSLLSLSENGITMSWTPNGYITNRESKSWRRNLEFKDRHPVTSEKLDEE